MTNVKKANCEDRRLLRVKSRDNELSPCKNLGKQQFYLKLVVYQLASFFIFFKFSHFKLLFFNFRT